MNNIELDTQAFNAKFSLPEFQEFCDHVKTLFLKYLVPKGIWVYHICIVTPSFNDGDVCRPYLHEEKSLSTSTDGYDVSMLTEEEQKEAFNLFLLHFKTHAESYEECFNWLDFSANPEILDLIESINQAALRYLENNHFTFWYNSKENSVEVNKEFVYSEW